MSTAVTTGSWSSLSVAPPNLTGLGTEHVRWGIPAGSGQSGYVFRGDSVEVRTDGTEFTLGTYTHENFPVVALPERQFDVDLVVRVAFEDGTNADFSFRFHHNETPNDSPTPDDVVDLPTFVSPRSSCSCSPRCPSPPGVSRSPCSGRRAPCWPTPGR
jgi:hypothetical protein